MKHLSLRRSVAAFAIVFALSPAIANADQPAAVTVSVGAYTMTNANAQSGGSSGTGSLSLGAEYTFTPSNSHLPQSSAYADLLGLGGTQTNRLFALGLALRTPGAAYGGAGVGYDSVTLAPAAGCPAVPTGPPCTAPHSSASGIGGKVFVGYAFTQSVRLQLDYHVLPTAGGTPSNAFDANIGFRL